MWNGVVTSSLLAVHVLGSGGYFDRHALAKRTDFLSFLAEAARRAAPGDHEVIATTPFYVVLLAYFSADNSATDKINNWAEHQEPVKNAAVPDFLGHLAGRITRAEICYDTNAAVVETTTQAVLERHDFDDVDW